MHGCPLNMIDVRSTCAPLERFWNFWKNKSDSNAGLAINLAKLAGGLTTLNLRSWWLLQIRYLMFQFLV